MDAFSAAAEPNRRRILQLLASAPRTVGDIAAEFTVTRSAISQHLLLLADAGSRDSRQGRPPTDLPRRTLRLALAAGRDRPVLDRRARPARRRRPRTEEQAMTYTKTVTLPVSPDDAFALVTQPERLRRWMTVSAYVDLRAGGELSLDRRARCPRRRHRPRGRARPPRRARLGLGGGRHDRAPTDPRRHRHDRTRRRRLPGHPGARGPDGRGAEATTRRAGTTSSSGSRRPPRPATRVRTRGAGRPRTSPR